MGCLNKQSLYGFHSGDGLFGMHDAAALRNPLFIPTFAKTKRLRMGKNKMRPKKANALKGVLDDYEAQLRSKQYKYDRIDDSTLLLPLVGKIHVMTFERHDADFLRVFALFQGHDFKCSRSTLLESCNQINYDTKVVKVYLDEDGDVEISAEMFLDRSRYFAEIFQRHISTIDSCAMKLMRLTRPRE